MIKIIEIEEFFKLQNNLDFIPFTQSRGWFNYISQKYHDFVFFVDSLDDTKIACWGKIHSVSFFSKKILLIEGESYKSETNEKVFRTFYTNLSKLNYSAIEINSNNSYSLEFEIGIRRSGFKRPLAHFSCPLTIEIDFSNDFKFDNNWKRNIRKADEAGLIFKEVVNVKKDLIIEISKIFKEMSDLKGLGYYLDSNSLHVLLKSNDIRTFVVENKNNEIIAARIVHFRKRYASDIFAANSNKSRNCGATYFMMQNIFERLKEDGFHFFDFGRIPPSNHSTDNIYTFKNSSRGKKLQYNGEWVLYKSRLFEKLILFYKLYKLKKQRY